MRLRYVLVTVTATLLACIAVAAPHTSQINQAKASSIGAVQGTPATWREGKTFLRSLTSRVDDRSEDEEERAGAALGMVDDVVVDIADDIPSLMAMFKRWKGLTVEEKFATPGLANLSEKKFLEILDLYGLYTALGPEMLLARLERIKAKAHPGRV